MFHSIVSVFLYFIFIRTILSQNLNGIFTIDSCECNSPTETCEPNGPFIINQKRSNIAIKYGSNQIGGGTLGKNKLDVFLNQNRCQGIWNGKTHLAELKCQHQGKIICTTNLRCISGSCLDDTTTMQSSASMATTISFLLMISILIIF